MILSTLGLSPEANKVGKSKLMVEFLLFNEKNEIKKEMRWKMH